jgi:hypothetical protein
MSAFFRLRLGGQERSWISLAAFRAQHNLAATFGIATFAPKSYVGLGSIAHAGPALANLRGQVLGSLPAYPSLKQWLAHSGDLNKGFAQRLELANAQVGLSQAEVGFAVAGFADILNQFLFAALACQAQKQPPPLFEAVYQAWLDNSAEVLAACYPYPPDWSVQLVSNAYGRVGLQISAATWPQPAYVIDLSLACPAAAFMQGLLEAVCAHIESKLS